MFGAVNTSARLPLLSSDVPGTGGRLRSRHEDFEVEEIPAYEPAGTGDHVFAVVEKTGRTTFDVVRELAAALGVSERDIGTAGLKDRHAVARQTISLPPPVAPESVAALTLQSVRIVSVARHPHKLRTGHLSGNRFRVVLRELDVPVDEAVRRARVVLDRLSSPPGAPNWFGPQRFGTNGSTAQLGRDLVHGRVQGRPPRGSKRRLAVSAYQSLLFNEVLRQVMIDGRLGTVMEGDVLKKTDTGGVFLCEDAAVDQARLERGELAITGPMFGHKVMLPTPGSDAARREQGVLEAESLDIAAFRHLGKIALGTRRPLSVRVSEPGVTAAGDDAIRVELTLPAGCYMTAVMREIIKGEPDFPE